MNVFTDPIDISESVKALCESLELDYNDVAELRIKPASVEALVFLKNENGSKYVDKISGFAVMTSRSFKVRS